MRLKFTAIATVVALGLLSMTVPARADSGAEIEQAAKAALADLMAENAAARTLAAEARGVLVFRNIVKFGLMVGAQGGEGALIKYGKAQAYYRTTSASFGLQAGVQRFGYVLFFMTDAALAYLDHSDGWEIGVGPSLVVVDEGIARSISTTTVRSDTYAYIFDQKGLMAGVGLQGTKVARFAPSR